MSQNGERVKNILTFKAKLEKRVEELQSELKEMQAMLEAVNSLILEKGFKRVELAKAPATAETLREEPAAEPEPLAQPASVQLEDTIPLKTVSGELLANLYISEDSVRVVLAEDKSFNFDTPPFSQFLVEKVFARMQEKDTQLARSGQLTAERIFSYNIVREGNVLREITIKNVDADRLRELKSSIRWTLEKMYEKTKGES
ncbi:MAG TPA: hypothetical protein VIH48_01740 [Candidatus Bathyarchaeia archaeon]